MARTRIGSHGQIAERTDGTIRMTIRPEPRAFDVEDLLTMHMTLECVALSCPKNGKENSILSAASK